MAQWASEYEISGQYMIDYEYNIFFSDPETAGTVESNLSNWFRLLEIDQKNNHSVNRMIVSFEITF